MTDGVITFWVITRNPSDYPNKYVVRAQRVRGTVIHYDLDCTVHDTLEEARASVPPGCWRFTRAAEDDPVIVESWMQ